MGPLGASAPHFDVPVGLAMRPDPPLDADPHPDVPLGATLHPDVPLGAAGDPSASAADAAGTFARTLAGALAETRTRLERAGAAENAFVTGRGSLQAMVLDRASADVALSIATAAASRVTQSLTTILGMQV